MLSLCPSTPATRTVKGSAPQDGRRAIHQAIHSGRRFNPGACRSSTSDSTTSGTTVSLLQKPTTVTTPSTLEERERRTDSHAPEPASEQSSSTPAEAVATPVPQTPAAAASPHVSDIPSPVPETPAAGAPMAVSDPPAAVAGSPAPETPSAAAPTAVSDTRASPASAPAPDTPSAAASTPVSDHSEPAPVNPVLAAPAPAPETPSAAASTPISDHSEPAPVNPVLAASAPAPETPSAAASTLVSDHAEPAPVNPVSPASAPATETSSAAASTPVSDHAEPAPVNPVSAASAPAPETPSADTPSLAATADATVERVDDALGSKELIEEITSGPLGQRGELWFAGQLLALLLVASNPFELQGLISVAGAVGLVAGLGTLVYGQMSLGRNLSPLPVPRNTHALVTDGMYAYVRHPMYSGLLAASLGLACVTHSEGRLVWAALLWWILEQKVVLEERSLEERYPGQYQEYRSRVKKFVPFLY